jgi:hypothetical protein
VARNLPAGRQVGRRSRLKICILFAHVAELVDAADSKSAIRKGVKVRFLSWAQKLFIFEELFSL